MRETSTEPLVIRPRASPRVRLAIVSAAIMALAAAALGGYFGGRATLAPRLQARTTQLESLRGQLRESHHRLEQQQAEARATRDRIAAQAEARRAQIRAELGDTRTQQRAELESTRERLTSTRQRLEDARSSLAKVTRQLQVDQTAYQALRAELQASNRQIAELAEELRFYRSIISPADGRSGVRIQKFAIEPGDGGREYRYRLVLIQSLEHESTVAGQVRLEISGTQGGASRSIAVPGSGAPLTVEFRYFRNLAGRFSLPADFVPAEVTVIFADADQAEVRRIFAWPATG